MTFALVRSIQVGARYVATFRIPAGEPGESFRMVVDWEPERPVQFTDGEMLHFRRGRAQVLRELEQVTGQRVEYDAPPPSPHYPS